MRTSLWFPPAAAWGGPGRENFPRGGEQKFGENRKIHSPNFLPLNSLKSHKTTKEKFGKAWRKPPNIYKKFGKSLEKTCKKLGAQRGRMGLPYQRFIRMAVERALQETK